MNLSLAKLQRTDPSVSAGQVVKGKEELYITVLEMKEVHLTYLDFKKTDF